MRYRKLGRTGFEVSEVGFGAWGIGGRYWGGADDALSLRALRRAFDLGVNFVDTALAYGDGHSERLVGRAIREFGGPIRVATKIPPKAGGWPPAPGTPVRVAFPADYIVSSTEQSLKNLGLDCLELQQLHTWRDEWLVEGEWQEAVSRLKAQRKVRAFGLSVIDHRPDTALRAVASGLIDTVQVIFNIFDQSPRDELLPLCRAHGVGLIARVPFDEGSLTGALRPDTRFPSGDFRSRYFRGERLGETCRRVVQLAFLVRDEIKSLAQASLKFCLSHAEVSTVIPGMRRPEHVDENCAASDGIPLRPEELAALRAHAWPRNFYE
ncbi:MAG: aldo/keto reductase [Candidatus Rokubacteria bacterium]|nr:aldo/keto reductase [Candidatus Rokubacteria bacterium]